MRSEKEAARGLGAALAARGPSGREKPSAMEVQFRRESPPTTSSGCGGGADKPREEKRTVLSKVVIRRLPPSLTKEQLEEQLHPLPAHDYFEFFTADLSLFPHLYSRAYINFRNPEDILLFRDRFDGYIFIDSKVSRCVHGHRGCPPRWRIVFYGRCVHSRQVCP
uniref:UPF3A regulator of nonsense mediated mRNA decay n=1 Tax=Equus caballus TaxID=9796 RepID=A0A9L0RLC0_HORSE